MIKLENENTIETVDTKERKYKMFEEYKTISIKLEKFNDILKFVNLASKYNNLDVRSGRYVVSANSLMGVLSLDLDNPIRLSFIADYEEDIRNDFSEWIVEV